MGLLEVIIVGPARPGLAIRESEISNFLIGTSFTHSVKKISNDQKYTEMFNYSSSDGT